MDLLDSINDFFIRFPEAKQLGKQTNLSELDTLPRKIKNNIPELWKKALIEFPICNLEIGVPSDFGQPELTQLPREKLPLMTIKFLSPKEISEDTTHYFPGLKLIQSNLFYRTKYIQIATDTETTGEGIFIATKEKDPRPLLLFHDAGSTKRSLIKHSESISSRLTTLFQEAQLKNRYRVLPEQRLNRAKALLEPFINELKTVTLSTPDSVPETHSDTEQSILRSFIDNYSTGIAKNELVAYLDKLPGIVELSIPNKKEFWQQIHTLYDTCELHKGDLFFFELNAQL